MTYSKPRQEALREAIAAIIGASSAQEAGMIFDILPDHIKADVRREVHALKGLQSEADLPHNRGRA